MPCHRLFFVIKGLHGYCRLRERFKTHVSTKEERLCRIKPGPSPQWVLTNVPQIIIEKAEPPDPVPCKCYRLISAPSSCLHCFRIQYIVRLCLLCRLFPFNQDACQNPPWSGWSTWNYSMHASL